MAQKLTWPQKLSFGMGAFGKDLVYAIVATYIFYYFTDVCFIAPAVVGTIFLVSRIFDAVNDPVMGWIVDNTRSRYGKFKPWLVIGTVINSIILILLFIKFDLSPSMMIVYAATMYILWGVTYTIMDIPYWSMVPDLGTTKEKRDQVSAIPRLFASAAGLCIGGFGMAIVETTGKGNDALGFSIFAVIVAIGFILCVGLTVINVPVRHNPGQDGTSAQKTTIPQMLKVLFRNEQVMCVLIIAILFNLMVQFNGGIGIYFLKYVSETQKLTPAFLFSGSLAQMAGIFAYPFLARIMSKTAILSISGILCLTCSAIIFTVKDFNLMWVVSAAVSFGISGGLTLPILTVMLADSVDYGERKFGTRNESIIFSTQTFVVKLASAFSGFIIGLGLQAANFEAEKPLMEEGKQILTFMMGGMPFIMFACYMGVYWLFYRRMRQSADKRTLYSGDLLP